MPDVRLIVAKDVDVDLRNEYLSNADGIVTAAGMSIFNAAIDRARCAVMSSPTIDAAPVVHARWKWEGRFKACSKCGTYIDWDNTLGASHWHYCPNCGAKMDGGAEG